MSTYYGPSNYARHRYMADKFVAKDSLEKVLSQLGEIIHIRVLDNNNKMIWQNSLQNPFDVFYASHPNKPLSLSNAQNDETFLRNKERIQNALDDVEKWYDTRGYDTWPNIDFGKGKGTDNLTYAYIYQYSPKRTLIGKIILCS